SHGAEVLGDLRLALSEREGATRLLVPPQQVRCQPLGNRLSGDTVQPIRQLAYSPGEAAEQQNRQSRVLGNRCFESLEREHEALSRFLCDHRRGVSAAAEEGHFAQGASRSL